ncbi:MAG: hypothetical protein Q4P66_02905 [Actinomycetaceae bacterium]|nr:hypothetical protein [Actinomycetaceae bacterium]
MKERTLTINLINNIGLYCGCAAAFAGFASDGMIVGFAGILIAEIAGISKLLTERTDV